MKYSIFVKYNNNANRPLYEQYGLHNSTTGSSSTTFVPFETDDMEVLENTILELDKVHGHENLIICKVIEATYGVEIADDEQTPVHPDDTTSGDPTTP